MTDVGIDAILLASFGGPEGPDEVMPFLERVTAGRGVPRDRLESVAHHYLALGGVSPINAQNRQLLAALRTELDRRGIDVPLYWGNRNSAPFFADAVRQIHADGRRRVVAIATSAYSSYSGCRQYRENLAAALVESGAGDEVEIVKVRPYYDQPGFTEPFAAGLTAALTDLDSQGVDVADIHVLFTTHSIPTSMALSSGPADLRTGEVPGRYERQHLDAAERAMRATSAGALPDWSLVYQSRSGPPQVPWLEPDVNDALEDLAARGIRAVVIAPIGFISDHVEVVWDLDHEAADTAERLGLTLLRVTTPGTDPAFVSALADVAQESMGGRQLAHGADWSGLCAGACCPNARTDLPVIAGV